MYAGRYSLNESGRIGISSPLPRNSVAMSDDKNFELLPVTNKSAFGFRLSVERTVTKSLTSWTSSMRM